MRNVDELLALARSGSRDAAFHNLIELGEPAIARLGDVYRAEPDPHFRAWIVEAVWQTRAPAAIPILGEALLDPAPEVWKQALDGLVTLATHDALRVLEAALEQVGEDRPELREWLEGAIDDVGGRMNE